MRWNELHGDVKWKKLALAITQSRVQTWSQLVLILAKYDLACKDGRPFFHGSHVDQKLPVDSGTINKIYKRGQIKRLSSLNSC